MKLADRVMSRPAFARALAEERGTLIEEWASPNAPVRYWWVEDNLTESSPHKWTSDGFEAVFQDDEYGWFSSWCHEKYLESGNAKLVASSHIPEMRWSWQDSKPNLTIPVVAISAAPPSGREKTPASKLN